MKKSRLIFLGTIVLILNLVWEFSHHSLYIDLTGIPSTLHLIIAGFTDLLLVSFMFSIISIFKKSMKWTERPDKFDYFFIILLGIVISSSIEIYSLSNGRWAYTGLMPVIFGIGISPLIQLFTTAIFSLLLIRLIK